MIAGLSCRRVARVLAAPLLALPLLCGCGESLRYSPDLRYPLRSDPIVDTSSTEQTWASEQPGRLDESVAVLGKKQGGKTTDPNVIDPDLTPALRNTLRGKLRAALDETFGTPYQPRVGGAHGEDAALVEQLRKLKLRDADDAAPFHTLATGSKAYRFHCVHCHGLTGDGRGPTGPWVVPHPRDYRSGKFKFISSQAKGRPRRDDLLRTLHQGIDGTSMPSFALLSDEELNGLASYVMHLSIRGEVEKNVVTAIANGEHYRDGEGIAEAVHDQMAGNDGASVIGVVPDWIHAAEKPVVPDPKAYKQDPSDKQKADSIRRGYAAFSNASGTASCIGCHQDYGRQVPFKYDAWGTLVRPANLTLGVYRGGRRPIDLFWRIRCGIDPSGMPAQASNPNDPQSLKDDQVWDIVNFVQALPYPQMLPTAEKPGDVDVRKKIYGPVDEQMWTERVEK